MRKIKRPTFNVEIEDLFKYKLVRENDGMSTYGHKVGWIEWTEDGSFKKLHDKAAVGRSLIVDPHAFQFTWMTTSIKEILEETENYIKFATLNSKYELWKND